MHNSPAPSQQPVKGYIPKILQNARFLREVFFVRLNDKSAGNSYSIAKVLSFNLTKKSRSENRILKYLGYKPRLALWFLESLRIFCWIPYSWQLKLGRWLGRRIMKHSPKMRRNVLTNLRACFPNQSEAEYQTLARQSFESVGIGFFETAMAAWGSDKRLNRLLHSVHGWEEVEKTLAAKQGAIILFPHLVPMYLVGRLMLLQSCQPFSLMYHRPKNPALGHFLQSNLKRFCDEVFNRHDVRDLVRYVKAGNLVWYAPDLDIGDKSSLFIPFFGVPAATLTAPMRLAKLTGARVFPIAFYRQETGGYAVTVKEPLPHFPSGDDVHDLQQINHVVENIVAQKPEQYLWLYKRFNTRPEGEPRFYN